MSADPQTRSRSNAGQRGPRSVELKARVFELLREGLDRNAIAERLGISTRTISQYVNGRRDG